MSYSPSESKFTLYEPCAFDNARPTEIKIITRRTIMSKLTCTLNVLGTEVPMNFEPFTIQSPVCMHHKEVVHLQKVLPSKSNRPFKIGYPETKLCEGELSKSPISCKPSTVCNLTRKRKEEQNVLSVRKV